MVKKDKKHSGFASSLERIGNKIPHPIYIFIFLIIVIMISSSIAANSGVSVVYDAIGSDGNMTKTTAEVVNLLSRKQLQAFLVSIIDNFKNATTVMNILTLVLCMSIAEYSGFFEVSLKATLSKTPKFLVTYILSVIGICSSIMADSGMVLSASLGAIAYKSIGRNPAAGLIVGYASAAAGYTGNLFPSATDVTLNSVTEVLAPQFGFTSNVLSNWYFLIVSTLILAAVTTFVAETITEKMFSKEKTTLDIHDENSIEISASDKRGLKFASIATLITILILLILAIPQNGFLRSDDGSLLPSSPLIKGLVPIIGIFFVVMGISFGIGSKRIQKSSDIPNMMAKGVSAYSQLIVVMFMASQMIALFNLSKLGTVIAVRGQEFLTSINLTGLPLLIIFSLIVTTVNLFMASNSAKWFIFGPVFIPIFARMNIHPAITQLAYRIGDSCTNNITPISSGFVIAIALLAKYLGDKEENNKSVVGTMIVSQLPYSIAYFIAFSIVFAIFYLFNIPVGVGIK